MAEEKRVIQHVGRDYIEHVEGDFYSGASGQATQQINAQSLADNLTPDSPKEDVAQLLALVKQELAKLELDEEVKGEIVHDVEGAELQIKKAEPNKPKMAGALKSATDTLKEFTSMVPQAVAVGNMLGKAILWCGEQWMTWGI